MDIQLLLTLITTNWHIITMFFVVAILYSSVGFGGGSSYLAILALTEIAFTQIRSAALLCNIIVVSGNVLIYISNKEYDWKKTFPLVLFSVPMAFLGGYLKINQTFFFILLGISLLFASITMWFFKTNSTLHTKKTNPYKNATYGGLIGFISGIVGIGGGIFLAPLLHLINWDTPKKIAATASFFILMNSAAGLMGQYTNPNFIIDWNLTLILLVTVFVGGQIGSRTSNNYLSQSQLKKVTAILIGIVSIRILIKTLL